MPSIQRDSRPDLHYVIDDYTDSWKNAPYLVLQHGNGRAGSFWYSWVPYLSRFYKVVRPDMRGLGKSSPDFDFERGITVDDLVGDLVSLVDELGAGPVHFCGEAMGGILGLAFAAFHPERVRTLTLVGTPVYISDRMKQTYSMGHKSRVDAMQEMGRDAWLKATNRSTRFPPDTDPGLLEWYENEYGKNSEGVQLAMSRLVNEVSAVSFLASVQAPVLGLYPTSGPVTSQEQEDLLTASLRNFRLVHLAARHALVHMIEPAACASHLLHFVSQHDGAACRER